VEPLACRRFLAYAYWKIRIVLYNPQKMVWRQAETFGQQHYVIIYNTAYQYCAPKTASL